MEYIPIPRAGHSLMMRVVLIRLLLQQLMIMWLRRAGGCSESIIESER